jgi:glycosyltransferase involved in cell wall biosynthesis
MDEKNIGFFCETFTPKEPPDVSERLFEVAQSQGFNASILTFEDTSDQDDVIEINGTRALYRHLKHQDYDYIYSYNSYRPGLTVPLIARLTSTRPIHAPHCTGIHGLQNPLKNAAKRYYSRTIMKNGILRCLSRWEYDKYLQMEFSESQLLYAPYGIDQKRFSSISPVFDSRETFAVANARPFKNIETQVRAAALLKDEIPDYHHHLIGGWEDEEYRDTIEAMITDLGLEETVTVHGFIPRDKMFEIMENCHTFVHTSHFETEGLVLYEAASSGFPVCVSDNPVHNRNFERFLHDDSDHEGLADDIKETFELQADEKQAIKEDMRSLGEEFSYENEMDRLNSFFKDLMSRDGQ